MPLCVKFKINSGKRTHGKDVTNMRVDVPDLKIYQENQEIYETCHFNLFLVFFNAF